MAKSEPPQISKEISVIARRGNQSIINVTLIESANETELC